MAAWGVIMAAGVSVGTGQQANAVPGRSVAPQLQNNTRVLLSELEQARLDNLKLQKQLLVAQIQLAQRAYTDTLAKFAVDTIKAHGGVQIQFDVDKMEFVAVEEKK